MGGGGGGRGEREKRLVIFLGLSKSHDNSIYQEALPLIYILHEVTNYKVLLNTGFYYFYYKNDRKNLQQFTSCKDKFSKMFYQSSNACKFS